MSETCGTCRFGKQMRLRLSTLEEPIDRIECRRFPNIAWKGDADWCGEYQRCAVAGREALKEAEDG